LSDVRVSRKGSLAKALAAALGCCEVA
jgi:hypothetical protein